MLTLLLVRHATHDLVGKVLAGRMPGVDLSTEGRTEAGQLAERLARHDVDAVMSSPLERALGTAAPIAARHRLPVATDEALVEIDCGEWTGRSFAALRDDPRWAAWNRHRAAASVPGGEAMRAVQERAVRLVRSLGSADRTMVLVSHGDVIKTIVCDALGLSLDRHDSFAIDPASVTTLHVWAEASRLIRLNETVNA